MMTCRELAELLLDFVAEELEAERCRQIEQHLSCCRHCVTFVETYRLTITLTRKLSCNELPVHVLKRLQAALEAELKPPPPDA